MKELVAEWIRKAEADAGTAKREAVEEDAKSALVIMERVLALLCEKTPP